MSWNGRFVWVRDFVSDSLNCLEKPGIWNHSKHWLGKRLLRDSIGHRGCVEFEISFSVEIRILIGIIGAEKLNGMDLERRYNQGSLANQDRTGPFAQSKCVSRSGFYSSCYRRPTHRFILLEKTKFAPRCPNTNSFSSTFVRKKCWFLTKAAASDKHFSSQW